MQSATIERVLLDPRNRSKDFWRERRERFGLSPTLPLDVTPFNAMETARLHLSVAAQAVAEQTKPNITRENIESLAAEVIQALDFGAALTCPRCGTRCHKNDACIHMDSCACGSNWCFLCGKISGRDAGQCPRGEGGCDEINCYLEKHPGWGEFALEEERSKFGEHAAAYGAQKEFLR